ncbi:ribosomal protein S18-alanine N-acetyltransferase [bacterium]|nr:ribosomal protein S18-alanine N-acetyltransferase [bacterium]
MKNFKIRRMEKSDLDQVMQIEAEAYGEHHWSKDSFCNELENNLSRYYSAVDENNNLLGYLGAWFIFEEAHVTTVAVRKQCKKQGIANALMLHLIDACYENMIKYVTLEVRVSNIPALGLYTKWGFKDVGVRKGYYQDNNEDALIMFTENIFHEKFKNIYNENKEKMENFV